MDLLQSCEDRITENAGFLTLPRKGEFIYCDQRLSAGFCALHCKCIITLKGISHPRVVSFIIGRGWRFECCGGDSSCIHVSKLHLSFDPCIDHNEGMQYPRKFQSVARYSIIPTDRVPPYFISPLLNLRGRAPLLFGIVRPHPSFIFCCSCPYWFV